MEWRRGRYAEVTQPAFGERLPQRLRARLRAESDAANALRLDYLEPLVRKLQQIDAAARDRVIPTAASAPSGARV